MQVIGKYEYGQAQLIGHGAFALVYKGHHSQVCGELLGGACEGRAREKERERVREKGKERERELERKGKRERERERIEREI